MYTYSSSPVKAPLMQQILRLQNSSSGASFICSSCRRQLRIISNLHRGLQNRPWSSCTSRLLKEDVEQHEQAQPLGDFYTDLLATPIPQRHKESSLLPTFAQSGDDTKEERARRLFGDMHSSSYERRISETPDATWKTVNGVPIPPRPAEPDNCCMSGCAHCVWDDYRDDVENWAVRVHKAQVKSRGETKETSLKVDMPRPEVIDASTSMDDDGGGSETLWNIASARGGEDLFEAIPVGIREFMATEKKIRDRQKTRKQSRKKSLD